MFSKAILALENQICNFEFDPFYGSTFGSAIWTISDRMEFMETFCETCVASGDYRGAERFNKAFKQKCKEDSEKANSKAKSQAPPSPLKTPVSHKIEKRILKMLTVTTVRALCTSVDQQYKKFMTPRKTSRNVPRRDPTQEHGVKPRDVVGPEEVPGLLRDTFTMYQFYKNSPGGLSGKG